MTTHVFIVDETTFKYHLEYMFVGTGAKDNDVDFNNNSTTTLHYSKENLLVGMMADGSRLRQGDYVIFYLQSTVKMEGKFYGIFKVVNDGIFLDNNNENQYLRAELKKNLTFRQLISPYIVYSEGVSEWEALDEIKCTPSPYQMIWSLIYRKLKGNRGNTMITMYEANKLFRMLECKNPGGPISSQNFTYNLDSKRIESSSQDHIYEGISNNNINILPRLISKYNSGRAHESHLQMFITQNIGKGTNLSLDEALGINGDNIEWIGNEVSCGVGMQRIDVMYSRVVNEIQCDIVPIELKAVPASIDNIRQIKRYIDWIEQYYIPNKPSTICPTLICKSSILSSEVIESFNRFNADANGRYKPLTYIEYKIEQGNIIFRRVQY